MNEFLNCFSTNSRTADLGVISQKLAHITCSSLFYSMAERQRLAGLDEGYVGQSWWADRLVWNSAKRELGLDRLRALIVVDGKQ